MTLKDVPINVGDLFWGSSQCEGVTTDDKGDVVIFGDWDIHSLENTIPHHPYLRIIGTWLADPENDLLFRQMIDACLLHSIMGRGVNIEPLKDLADAMKKVRP